MPPAPPKQWPCSSRVPVSGYTFTLTGVPARGLRAEHSAGAEAGNVGRLQDQHRYFQPAHGLDHS